MDSNLLCDEVWLSPPASPPNATVHSSLYAVTEDCELSLSMFLEKEDSYMPNHGYAHYLHSHNLILSRYNAIQWLIKCSSRLNLSMATLFNAANYLDRFISIKNCQEWKNWMMELLSVACLFVASKFVETYLPSIYEIQMEGLNHIFEAITIQQMELILLDTLNWRLSSTTAYSYVELVTTIQLHDFFKCTLQKELFVDWVTQLLISSILEDYKIVECGPSVTAIAAVWCALEEIFPAEFDGYMSHITSLLNKEEIVKCRDIMKKEGYKCPTSPDTVLLGVYDASIDLSIFNIQPHPVPSNKKIRRMP